MIKWFSKWFCRHKAGSVAILYRIRKNKISRLCGKCGRWAVSK